MLRKSRAKTVGVEPRWITGYPLMTEGRMYIAVNDMEILTVQENTLGAECPILFNEKPIYEGDVLSFTAHKGYLIQSCKLVVVFDDQEAAWGLNRNRQFGDIFHFARIDEVQSDILDHCEMIGNIFDNQF